MTLLRKIPTTSNPPTLSSQGKTYKTQILCENCKCIDALNPSTSIYVRSQARYHWSVFELLVTVCQTINFNVLSSGRCVVVNHRHDTNSLIGSSDSFSSFILPLFGSLTQRLLWFPSFTTFSFIEQILPVYDPTFIYSVLSTSDLNCYNSRNN